MIDSQKFLECLLLLQQHYERSPLQPTIITIWKEYLDSEITTEEFEEAIKHTIINSRFFPAAADLVQIVKGSKEAKALQEWQMVVRAAAGFNQSSLAYLSPRANVALAAVGGLQVVGLTEDRFMENLRRSFVTVYCQCSQSDAKQLKQSAIKVPAEEIREEPSYDLPWNMDELRSYVEEKNAAARSRDKYRKLTGISEVMASEPKPDIEAEIPF